MAQDDHFTVFIRLPFPRGDFVDPPPGMHFEFRANQFGVDLSFLLQQAAWLYDRQLSQVKAQLRKVSKPPSTAQSPTPSSVSGSGVAGGHAMARTGSGGARVQSSLAMRQRERPNSQGEGSTAGIPPPVHRARMSRNSSSSTVYQVRRASPSVTQQQPTGSPTVAAQFARTHEGSRKSSEAMPQEKPPPTDQAGSLSSKADDSSSSSSESEAAPSLSRSRAYMRRPRHTNAKPPLGPLSDDDDQEDADSPPFLPFSDPKATKHGSPPTDPSATLRMAKRNLPSKHTQAARPPLNSSSSSAQSTQPPKTSRTARQHPTSPHRTNIPNEPASALSPRQRRATGKDGSDGTPSMGSSFSDLDDASVTQSALEEALAQEMNQGGVASRMSTISQALRSRYL
ncbi:MAG: hypothetical protein Q9201_003544 [Fulgogasparrea decipioides]